MEKLKIKHDHSLTDILKVLIFAIVLLMPFLVYAPTALYYGFNEHATGTTTVTEGGYQVTTMYETNEVNSINDLVNGNIYSIDLTTQNNYQSLQNVVQNNGEIYLTYIYWVDSNYDVSYEIKEDLERLYYIRLYYDRNKNCFAIDLDYENPQLFYVSNVKIYFVANWTNYIEDIETEQLKLKKSDFIPYLYTYEEEVEVQKNITQMMEKNWNDLWKTNLFKWTDTSILKNGLDNFTQAFGITNTSNINNLIAYELIMVGVYIVIDIVLGLFKWLTHMIGNK